MCIAARSKAEARIREARIEDRREHLGDGLLDHTVCDRGNSKQAFAAVEFGDFHPSHRLRPVSPALDPRAQHCPVFARMGGKVLHGHAVYARRSLVGLHPFPRARQVVSGQHRLQQVLGCRFVLSQGSVRAGRRRIFPGRGRRCGRGRQRLLLVSRCSALRRPDTWPPTTTFADFCAVTARVAARRAVASMVSRCRFIACGGQLAAAPGPWSPGVVRCRVCHPRRAPLAVQISPGKNANCRCTSAAFTVGCVPVGFAVLCQLASHPSALTMRFLSVASHLLHSGFLRTRPRGLALAVGSWLSLLTMSPSRYLHRDFHPMSSRPCWAHNLIRADVYRRCSIER